MIVKNITTEDQRSDVLENEAISFMSVKRECEKHEKYINEKNTFGLFNGNELCSSLSVFPYSANLYNTSLPVWGIGHVATFPEFREKGYFKKLIKNVFKNAVEKEIPVVSLFPYSYELYRKVGFIELFWTSLVHASLDDIKNINSGQLYSYNLKSQENLHKLYSSYIENKNGCEIRDKDHWKQCLTDKSCYTYVWRNNEGEVKGYVTFEIDNQKENPCKVINIKEIIYDSEVTFISIIGHLKKWYPRVQMIKWLTIGDIYLPKILNRINNQTVVSQITTMFRVIDVRNAIRYWHPHIDNFRTILRVRDNFCEWNSVTLELTIKDDEAGFIESNRSPEIEMSIEAFTQMLFGAISYQEAKKSDEFKFFNDKSSDFSMLFQKRTIQMFDSF